MEQKQYKIVIMLICVLLSGTIAYSIGFAMGAKYVIGVGLTAMKSRNWDLDYTAQEIYSLMRFYRISLNKWSINDSSWIDTARDEWNKT